MCNILIKKFNYKCIKQLITVLTVYNRQRYRNLKDQLIGQNL